MIYHPRENKVTKIIKLVAFWMSLFAMFWLFILMFHDDIKIPQKSVTVKLDMKNRVNICLPEDDEVFSESFFDF